jgi:peroxiredoxin
MNTWTIMAAITDGAMTGGVTTITTAITIIIITTDATLAVDDGLAPVAHCNIRGRSAGLEYHRSIAGIDHGEACVFLSCDAAGNIPYAMGRFRSCRARSGPNRVPLMERTASTPSGSDARYSGSRYMKRLAASDDAKATIATARQMGVSVKMVTGDALAIAQETAKKLGMGANILDAGSLGDEKQQKTMAAAKAIENADGFAPVFLAQRPPRPIRARRNRLREKPRVYFRALTTSPRTREKTMLKSREGQKVPNVTFPIRVNDEWQKVSSDALFTDKTVVLFALPGAFTPTCSSTHLPRYNELAGVFKANGIDSVICLAVNDPFVMETWKEEQNAKDICFLPDGNGEFTEGMGLLWWTRRRSAWASAAGAIPCW